MKSLIVKWISIRLYLVLALVARYFLAYTVSKHWNVPIEDALLGVLLFSVSWTDTQLYFALRDNPQGLSNPSNPSKHTGASAPVIAASKESPTHAQIQQAALVLRSNIRS